MTNTATENQVPPPATGDEDPAEVATTVTQTTTETEEALGDAGKQAIDRMKAERDEAKKQLKTTQRELAAAQQKSMSESERAVAEAEARGRQAAASELVDDLVQTKFEALAARRNPDYDTTSTFEFMDMKKFLDEEGRPDQKSIEAAVKRLVPERESGPPSFDGGARKTAPTNDMNAIIRRQALGGRSA